MTFCCHHGVSAIGVDLLFDLRRHLLGDAVLGNQAGIEFAALFYGAGMGCSIEMHKTEAAVKPSSHSKLSTKHQ